MVLAGLFVEAEFHSNLARAPGEHARPEGVRGVCPDTLSLNYRLLRLPPATADSRCSSRSLPTHLLSTGYDSSVSNEMVQPSRSRWSIRKNGWFPQDRNPTIGLSKLNWLPPVPPPHAHERAARLRRPVNAECLHHEGLIGTLPDSGGGCRSLPATPTPSAAHGDRLPT